MRHLHRLVNLKDYPELDAVLTAAETARVFGLARKTVMNAINESHVAAQLVGRIWLVSLRSANAYWRADLPPKLAH